LELQTDKMIHKLPNGNYEVTPAWLQEQLESTSYWKVKAEKHHGFFGKD
jgi:hypothetical protein